jgi:hypothetical protein
VRKKLSAAFALALIAGALGASQEPSRADSASIKLGYSKCAHCLPMA